MVESTKVMLDRTERRFSLNGALAWPLAAAAQQSTNSKRLAIFSPSHLSAHLHEHSESKFSRALFAELRRLGLIEGQNLKVESYGREQRRPFDSCSN
jgi:putative tryptophan/tyrosine transport system substrate-binding protein